jgi:chromosome segregation ATPase
LGRATFPRHDLSAMSERLDKLRTSLAELQQELAAVDSLDDAAREQLADAASEIGKRTERTSQAENSLKDRLVDFEASHPQLAIIVGRLLDGLGQLGI